MDTRVVKKGISLLLLSLAAILIWSQAEKKTNIDITGTWQGVLEVQGMKLHILFAITRDSTGTLTALMDSPDQGAKGIPCSSVSYANEKVAIEIELIGGTVTGQLKDQGNTIDGTLTQNGLTFPIAFKRIAAVDAKTDTANPEMENIPALGDSVQVDTGKGRLFGSLQVPENFQKKTVVLIIAGSGPTDRDGNNTLIAGANNSLRMIAEALSRNGIASLRYDKRGIGQSAAAMKTESELQFDQYIDDAVAWLRWLRNNSRFSKIGILGHSEGSMIGMVAASRGQADFFISVAGVGRPIDQVMLEQLAGQSKQMHDAARVYLEKLKIGQTITDVPADMQMLFRPAIQPYWISLLKYDPAAEIKKIARPVLIIQGTTDLQISLLDAQLLKQAKSDARLKIIEGMNHIMKNAPAERDKNMATYSAPTLPLAKGFVAEIIDFLR